MIVFTKLANGQTFSQDFGEGFMSERAKEVARLIQKEWYTKPNATGVDLFNLIDSLPEFQERKWYELNCSACEQLLNDTGVWISRNGFAPFVGKARDIQHGDKWTYLRVPQPPKEEDSELVKLLKRRMVSPANDHYSFQQDFLNIVQEYERAKR